MKKIPLNNLDLYLYQETLDNGLQVFIIPMPNVNNIYATFSTKYGSNKIEFVPLNEKKMVKVPLGIAHFLEHKLFEQSNGEDPFSFYSERGSDANANTNQTKTTYLFSGPSFFDENINFLLDYVQSPYFTDKNVEKEKGIIEQEIKMYLDDADTQLYERLLANTFVNHPMKYPIIGTIESINKITKENLYTCYNTFYHPSNMFVVITGNIDPNEAIEIIKNNQSQKDFKKANKIDIKTYDEPDKVAKESDSMTANIGIPKIAVGYKIKLPNDNIYQNMLYYSILFDVKFGNTSLLNEELKNQEITNFNLSIGFDFTDKHALMFVVGDSKKPNVLIDKIKENFDTNISKEEFDRKKKSLISSLIYVSDNIFSLNNSIMNDIIRYGNVNCNRYDLIKDLNYKDFSNLIKKTNFKNITTFTVNPK